MKQTDGTQTVFVNRTYVAPSANQDVDQSSAQNPNQKTLESQRTYLKYTMHEKELLEVRVSPPLSFAKHGAGSESSGSVNTHKTSNQSFDVLALSQVNNSKVELGPNLSKPIYDFGDFFTGYFESNNSTGRAGSTTSYDHKYDNYANFNLPGNFKDSYQRDTHESKTSKSSQSNGPQRQNRSRFADSLSEDLDDFYGPDTSYSTLDTTAEITTTQSGEEGEFVRTFKWRCALYCVFTKMSALNTPK